MHRMTQTDLKHLTDKRTLYTRAEYTPEAQISLRFSVWPVIFKIQGCRKSDMHRMTPEWP